MPAGAGGRGSHWPLARFARVCDAYNKKTEGNAMNKSVLKKIGILFIFLSGIGIGASGLWLAIQNNIELRYFLLEQPTGNLPQAQVAAFVQSIIHNDKTAALNLWEVYDGASSEQQSALEKRRESVVSDLVSAKIDSEYPVGV